MGFPSNAFNLNVLEIWIRFVELNIGCLEALNVGFWRIQDLDQFQKPDRYLLNVIFKFLR
jgi:hypothetical protein